MSGDTTVAIQGNAVIMGYNPPPNDDYFLNALSNEFLNTPDSSLSVQGYQLELSLDDEFSVPGFGAIYFVTHSPDDPFILFGDTKIRIHDSGNTRLIDGQRQKLYGPCYIESNDVLAGTTIKLIQRPGSDAWYAVADVVGDGKFLLVFAHAPTVLENDGLFYGLRINRARIDSFPVGVVVPTVNGQVVPVYDSVYGVSYGLISGLGNYLENPQQLNGPNKDPNPQQPDVRKPSLLAAPTYPVGWNVMNI